MGSTDQVTFANTVLLIVMGLMAILVVIGLGLFAYRYQRTQAERKQQEAANITVLRFEAERVRVAKEAAAKAELVEEQAPKALPEASTPGEQAPRPSRRKPSNPDSLPRHSLR